MAQKSGHAWWWRSVDGCRSATQMVTDNESELLNAAVLCAALAATKAMANARASRELEMHVRKSPLPHTMQLPAVEFTNEYELVESESAFICAMRATIPSEIMQAVFGSASPLSQPHVHRFSGSRAHAPFLKRAQRLDLTKLYKFSRSLDADQVDAGGKEHKKEKHIYNHKKQRNESAEWMKQVERNSCDTALQNLPVAMTVGFGAPYAGNDALNVFLASLGINNRVVTFVNEFDCIPGILNIAHLAAMLAKTTERLVIIAKATKALLNLLPAPMQQQNCRYVDHRYAPCGSYTFMPKESAEFSIFSDTMQIRKGLGEDGDAVTISLTGNSILQHMMSAYVDAIPRRSRLVQINATMNHYERLGVARNATERKICTFYRSLAVRWYPDRIVHGSFTDQQKEVAEDIFELLAESYEVLSYKSIDGHTMRI
ncbi:unnamed protein product [Peronospora belbahrii]|uniref:J domain-containing protein n=1 Tax=Peronospora belbahrii TaxID=622444 RepID=A0ABN8CY71_9STRA|nr:unnamed protein product [Peronospora belbahrii]